MKDDAPKPSRSREAYHHGDLPSTLINEAAKLLAEKGAERFSMREVARRSDVAVAAPAHHFGNAKGLLTAIATCGFEELTRRQTASIATLNDPIEKVIRLCEIYVEMSTSHPGYAAVMFRWDLVDQTSAPYNLASKSSLELLTSSIAAAVSAEVSEEDTEHAAKTLWAAMHGFVSLSLVEGEVAHRRIDFAVRSLLAGMQT